MIQTISRRYIETVVMAQTGMLVQTGPFKNMRICDRASWGDGDLSPKLLGTYEQELHSSIMVKSEQRYGAIVIVGCAEGFYAVGTALLFEDIPILAFDIDTVALEITMENAALNNVAHRIFPRSICSGADLSILANEYRRLLVICDCEGYETELFREASTILALAHSDLMIECHDFMNANCTPSVIGFFNQSHLVEIVYCGGRNPNQFPFLSKFHDLERWLAVSENRPCVMNWV